MEDEELPEINELDKIHYACRYDTRLTDEEIKESVSKERSEYNNENWKVAGIYRDNNSTLILYHEELEKHVYRIWHCDSNDRREMGRIRAADLDVAISIAKEQILELDVEFETDWVDEGHVYLIMYNNEDSDIDDDDLEDTTTHYLEIVQDPDAEFSFRIVTGGNMIWERK